MDSKYKIEKVCYVCGLELDDYPYYLDSRPIANPEMICPCCGTHYGLDDEGGGKVEISDEIVDAYQNFGDDAHKKIIKILRKHWIDGGMKWWFPYPDVPLSSEPKNWDSKKQIENIPEEFK
jgi:hypothetical protein